MDFILIWTTRIIVYLLLGVAVLCAMAVVAMLIDAGHQMIDRIWLWWKGEGQ